MRIVKEGDTRKVLCHSCGPSQATYLLRDVDFSDKSGTVKNILAAVCDKCGQVVSIPSQSTPKIKAEFNKVKAPIEVRIPAHYLDILSLATHKIDPDLNESFYKNLLLYYLHAIYSGRFPPNNLAELLNTDLAKAKSSKRLSMKLSNRNVIELNEVMGSQGIKTNADVFKALILRINNDIVQQNEPKYIEELKSVAAAFA